MKDGRATGNTKLMLKSSAFPAQHVHKYAKIQIIAYHNGIWYFGHENKVDDKMMIKVQRTEPLLIINIAIQSCLVVTTH